MATLGDFYVDDKLSFTVPFEGQWSVIDPSGNGDFLTINDAITSGKSNLWLAQGNHTIEGHIEWDLEVWGDTPLRIFGNSKFDTFLDPVSTGKVFSSIAATYIKDFRSNLDYTVSTPASGQVRTITCYKGSDTVTAVDFNWNTLSAAGPSATVPYRIAAGDYIEMGSKGLFKIVEIAADGLSLKITGHNDEEDYVDDTLWYIIRNMTIEMSNISIRTEDHVSTVDDSEDELFNHRNDNFGPFPKNAWNQTQGMSYIINNVDTDTKYWTGSALWSAYWSYDGLGAGSVTNNFNSYSEQDLYMARWTCSNCYIDSGYTYANSTFTNVVFDVTGSIRLKENVTIINCKALTGYFSKQYDSAKIIGSEDKFGYIDDSRTANGTLPRIITRPGPNSTTRAGKYYDAAYFNDNREQYEANLDVITGYSITTTATGLPTYGAIPSTWDYSNCRRYYGIVTQDGATDDTLLDLSVTSTRLLNNLGEVAADNIVILFQNEGATLVDAVYVVEWVSTYIIRIKNSWANISPHADASGQLDGYTLYWPQVFVNDAVDNSLKKYTLFVDAKTLNGKRISDN
jgi:hypothetical protein